MRSCMYVCACGVFKRGLVGSACTYMFIPPSVPIFLISLPKFANSYLGPLKKDFIVHTKIVAAKFVHQFYLF